MSSTAANNNKQQPKAPAPALLKHANTYYEALHANAANEQLSGVEHRVFRGSVTTIFKTTNLSLAYYSKIMSLLVSCESVEFVQKGTSRQPSILVLHRPPTDAAAIELLSLSRRGVESLTRHRDVAKLQLAIENVARQIGGIDLPRAFHEIEGRLASLEKQASELATLLQNHEHK